MSDEIPVGSPPVPPGRHAAPGGWYADPARAGQERYWDGWNWTRNTREAEAPAGPAPGAGQRYGQHDGQPAYGPQYGQPAYGPQYGQPLPVTADGVPLAGWWFRVLAAVIDALVLGVVNEVLGRVTGLTEALDRTMEEVLAYATSGQQVDPQRMLDLMLTPAYYGTVAMQTAVAVAYAAVMLATRGATLGKMAVGLKVVPVGRGRHTGGLSWGAALLRPLSSQLMSLAFPLSLIDVLFPLWDRDRQALHDKIVKTQVVRTR